MLKTLLLLIIFAFSPQALSKADCFPNTINADMCKKAKQFVNYMAPQLPMTVNKNMSWYSVASIDTAIVATYRFTYDRVYLEQVYAKNVTSIDIAKKSMKKMASNICTQGKVPKAFISLGGKWVVNYTFSDGELFLRHVVDRCG